MPRFFTDVPVDGRAVITGADAVHIGRSLRMKVGEELTLCANGIEYSCVIDGFTEDEVSCKVLSAQPSKAEPSVKLTIFQALPKSDKMDLIVQKSVELGVSEIVPVITERCVSRPDEKSLVKKLVRWQKIALEAAKQCGRGIIPVISPAVDLKKCVSQLGGMDAALMCYEKGGASLSSLDLPNVGSIGVLIGCEGGFEPSEAEFAKANGVTLIGLGARILRCETAPLAAASIIMSLTGNM